MNTWRCLIVRGIIRLRAVSRRIRASSQGLLLLIRRTASGHWRHWSRHLGQVCPASTWTRLARDPPDGSHHRSAATGQLVRAIIDALGESRVLCGSACPRSSPAHELRKIMRLELPEDAMKKVMHDNASGLWGVAP
jgi:hypothetical protein